MKRYPMADPAERKRIYLPELSDTVSFMECTGLIPALPGSDAELAAYQELSSMAIPYVEDETPEKKPEP